MIDVVTLEVFNNRLKAIAEEMQFTLERSAHSPSIREGADCSAGIFDRDGNLISQATALPVHLGSLGPAIEGMVKAFPVAGMKECDVYIMNDPYAGGQHFPDIIMLVPVVHEGRVVALVCNLGHHQDIGGAAPGGNATNTTEIYQEGLRLPPLKLYDAGVPNIAVEAILRANVRIPDIVWGDLVAQTAAAFVGRQRVRALWQEMGGGKFDEAVRSLQDVAERMSRRVIERIPDGAYSFEDYLDNDGIELGRRVRIRARVSVKGSDVHVDFTGTDSQVRGPFNAVPSVTLSAVRYVVRCITGDDIPNNEGAYRMVSIHVPEGTLLNPRAPASISCRAVTARRVVDCVMGAFAQVLPDVVPAASHGHSFSQRIGGIDPESGAMWVTSVTGTGGMGARPAKDGVEAIQTDASNARNIPVEFFENYMPLQILEYGLRADSGGPGRHRGGLGLVWRCKLTRGEAVLSNRGERHYTQPWGLYGGMPGASSRYVLVRRDGTRELIPSKGVFTMSAGDELHVHSCGGGGHGDPLDRDPAFVLDDAKRGKVSFESAREHYGVAIDPATWSVQREETEKLRQALHKRRPVAGMVFDRGRVVESAGGPHAPVIDIGG
ncbi:MAG: hydantoinase B/oxoprolinase family protein [Betaproteobacteria bacterium]|nr:hydantoinase B/oxoprolinase family protein [Betaproteobacteria bacterium]